MRRETPLKSHCSDPIRDREGSDRPRMLDVHVIPPRGSLDLVSTEGASSSLAPRLCFLNSWREGVPALESCRDGYRDGYRGSASTIISILALMVYCLSGLLAHLIVKMFRITARRKKISLSYLINRIFFFKKKYL